MKKLIMVALAFGVMCSACTDERGAKKAAEDMGFSDVQVGGYPWFFDSCSDSDTFKTKFKAVNVHGQPVSGTVCSGWFKGKTVRLD
jgi:hypothetical protein